MCPGVAELPLVESGDSLGGKLGWNVQHCRTDTVKTADGTLGRQSDELRTPDLRAMRWAGRGGPVSGMPSSQVRPAQARPRNQCPVRGRPATASNSRALGRTAPHTVTSPLASGALRGALLLALGSQPADLGLDELVDLAVHDSGRIARLVASAQVLDVLVRMQHVVAYLGAPAPPRLAA